jgi:hypothetical protein
MPQSLGPDDLIIGVRYEFVCEQRAGLLRLERGIYQGMCIEYGCIWLMWLLDGVSEKPTGKSRVPIPIPFDYGCTKDIIEEPDNAKK